MHPAVRFDLSYYLLHVVLWVAYLVGDSIVVSKCGTLHIRAHYLDRTLVEASGGE